MADKKDNESDNGKKEPFIGSSDRPEVKIDPDMPLSELRVRDLATILGPAGGGTKSPFEAGKTPLKDFFDKPFPEQAKDWAKELKIEKVEKPEKPEKVEKNEKLEKHEKSDKHEKFEKNERKELKLEKIESDGVFDPGRVFEPPREAAPGADPRLESIMQAIAGLTRQVSALTDQVEELRRRSEDDG